MLNAKQMKAVIERLDRRELVGPELTKSRLHRSSRQHLDHFQAPLLSWIWVDMVHADVGVQESVYFVTFLKLSELAFSICNFIASNLTSIKVASSVFVQRLLARSLIFLLLGFYCRTKTTFKTFNLLGHTPENSFLK